MRKRSTRITAFWQDFQRHHPGYMGLEEPQSFYFCANKKDADECARLVVRKEKQATSPSLWWFDKNNEPLPEIGSLAIVTDWEGQPKAIIRTTRIEIVAFKDITPEHAFMEGEGDKSLDYWKRVHWAYYANEMKAFDEHPNEEMEIACEYFETIWNNETTDVKP